MGIVYKPSAIHKVSIKNPHPKDEKILKGERLNNHMKKEGVIFAIILFVIAIILIIIRFLGGRKEIPISSAISLNVSFTFGLLLFLSILIFILSFLANNERIRRRK